MQCIELLDVVPYTFADKQLSSDVWATRYTLQRGMKYLVDAESGAGKSTLCSYLIGLRADYNGCIRFDGKDTRMLSLADWREVRCSQIAMLYQELRLFPELTAWENIQIKNNLTHYLSDQQITQWMEQLQIDGKRDALVGKMSLGQQQRVAFIRALAQPFDVFVADEPISHLDEGNAAVMADILQAECARRGVGCVVTSIGVSMKMNYDKIIKL